MKPEINYTAYQNADDFLVKHPESNFLVSPEWAKTNQDFGHKTAWIYVKNQALALAIIKNARRGKYLEIAGCPLMDWQNTELVEEIFGAIRTLAKNEKCAFARIRPNLPATAENRQILAKNSLKTAPFHLHAEHTNIIDLTLTEEELLANMRRQTRYDVRQGIKRGIKISQSTTPAEFDLFFQIQQDTAKRQGFTPPSQRFLGSIHSGFGEKAQIYKSEHDGKLLSLALVLKQGQEAVYFEAASTPEARREPSAPTLLWQIIKDCKTAGFTRLNLWGIAYNNDPSHRYAKVTTFKRGFGGEDVTYLEAHDMIIRPLQYHLINKPVEIVRKKLRHL